MRLPGEPHVPPVRATDSRPERAAVGRERWSRPATFWIGTVALMATFATSSTPLPLHATYRTTARLTDADLSLTVVAYFVGTLAALLLLSRLSNHLGRRPVSALALVCVTAGAIVLLHVPDVAALALGRFLMGLGCGLAASALVAYVVDAAPKSPAWVGPVVASQASVLGLTLGAIGTGAIVEYGPEPLTTAYLVAAAIAILCLVLLLFSHETQLRRPGILASLLPSVRMPRHTLHLTPVAACVLSATWVVGAFYLAFGPSVTADSLDSANAVTAALVYASYMGPSVIGAPLAGRLSPAAGQRLGMVLLGGGLIAAYAALRAEDVVVFIVCSAVAGTGQGMANSATIRGLLHNTSITDRAPVLAAIYTVCYLSAMAAALVSAPLSVVYSLDWIAGAFCIFSVVAAAATLVAARNPK